MEPERLKQVEAIFAAALDTPPEDRTRLVEERCGGDGELVHEVELLLTAAAGQGAFDSFYLAFSTELDGPDDPSSSDVLGTEVGRYRLIEEIGRGGMGAVYRARRADGAFEQVVALKLLRHDIQSEALHAQLRNERQLLAHVDHPNIARLLDGGRTPDGRPFLVMEHVEGTPLDRYCDERDLTVDARLDLFLTVCAAVQHVHGHLVVHQDLKPRNILVTDEGRPMLLDFGIAKLSTLEAATSGTAEAVPRFLTPGYAAPEQLRGEPTTTATDVFQLGVLLCELLTGHRSLTVPDGGVAPIRPDPGRDLRAIVGKAVDPSPERRYSSVADLAQDIRRFRAVRPVLARPASRAYRLGKFVLRRRAGLAVAAALLVVAMGFTVSVVVQSQRVARERDRAAQVTATLTDLFAGADPLYGNDTLPLGEFVDRAARRFEAAAPAEPELQVELLTVLGTLFYNLTRPDDAERVWARALAIEEEVNGPSSLRSVALQVSLSTLRVDQGRPAEADSLIGAALTTLRGAGEGDSQLMGRALAQQAYVRQVTGSLDSAGILYREALPLLDTTTAGGIRAAAVSSLNMGFLEQGRGNGVAAEGRFREALRLRSSAFGPESPSNAVVWEALALVFRRAGRLDSAEIASARALRISEGSLPAPHRVIASNLNVRAGILSELGETRAADSLYGRALDMTVALYGEGAPAMAGIANNYAVFLERSGDPARARDLYRQSVAAYRLGFGEEHTYTAIVEANYARTLAAAGEAPAAVEAFRHALGILRETEFDPILAARPAREFGELMMDLGDYTAADSLFAQAAALWSERGPQDDDDLLDTQGLQGVVLAQLGRYQAAERLLQTTLEQVREKHGPLHENTRIAEERLAVLYRIR